MAEPPNSPDYSEDDDGDDMLTLKPALPIPNFSASVNPNIPPQTPEQYLSLVHTEAQTLPSVLIAEDHDIPISSDEHEPKQPEKKQRTDSRFHTIQRPKPLPESPEFTLPCSRWRHQVANLFIELQLALLSNIGSTSSISKSTSAFVIPSSPDQWLNHFEKEVPTLSFLKRLDFLTLSAALTASDDALTSDPRLILNMMRKFQLPLWLFSLLVFMQPPLDPDTAAVLHSLLRKAYLARSVIEKTEQETIASLNILITVLEDHYGQR